MYIYEAIIQLNMILVPIPVVIKQRKCSAMSCRPPGEHYHGYKCNSHVVMDLRIMPTESYTFALIILTSTLKPVTLDQNC